MFTIKNAIYVALLQLGVVVAGVLGAGLVNRFYGEMQHDLPPLVAMLMSHTLPFLAIPLVWIALALTVRDRAAISEGLKTMVFLSGIAVIIGLVVFVAYADAGPLLMLLQLVGGPVDDIEMGPP
jgi:hypothetical protein